MKKLFTFILATLLSINVFADPTVTISDIETTTTTVTATFTPNDDCASYYYLLGTEAEMAMWVQMMGQTLEELVVAWGIQTFETDTYTWTEQTPATEYTIYAVPFDSDNVMAQMVTALAMTQSSGGSGESTIEMEVEVLSEVSVKTYTTPNDQTAVYHYGLITKAYYDEIGEEGLHQVVLDDPYPYYEYSEWQWLNLEPNTEYYGFAQGQNSDGEWGEITLVPFVTTPTSVEDVNALSFNIFPNPTNDFVRIEGDNIKTVEIFNITGQTVAKYEFSGNEATISIGNLEAGVYFVKVNNTTTQKIIVR